MKSGQHQCGAAESIHLPSRRIAVGFVSKMKATEVWYRCAEEGGRGGGVPPLSCCHQLSLAERVYGCRRLSFASHRGRARGIGLQQDLDGLGYEAWCPPDSGPRGTPALHCLPHAAGLDAMEGDARGGHEWEFNFPTVNGVGAAGHAVRRSVCG